MTTLSLLDGDIIAYRAAASNAKHGGDLEDLHYNLQATVDDWTERSGGDDYRIVITVGKTFRHIVYPEYKQNRKNTPKPSGFSEAREWLLKHPKVTWDSGYEADDVMALVATSSFSDTVMVIVSTDKDMRQVPGLVFNPDKDDYPCEISADDALLWRVEQFLTGDSTDGYAGIKNYGPKTFAKDVQNGPEEADDLLEWGFQMYESKGYDRGYAEQMLMCATILHNRLETGYLDKVRSFMVLIEREECAS